MAKTILVVEDDPAIRQLLQALLIGEGYDVVTAADGQEGLDALGRRRPDLVLSDILMPVLNGLELLRAIRAAEQYRPIPIVLMSAHFLGTTDTDDLGVMLLRKPFNVDDLLDVIEQLLQDDC